MEVCSQAECKYLCYHMYSCDHQCYDYSNGHICKHMHRDHSIWLQSNDIENSEHSNEETHDPLEITLSDADIVADIVNNVNVKEGQYTRLNVSLDSSLQQKTFYSRTRTPLKIP